MKKTEISALSRKEVEDEVERNWNPVAQTVKKQIGMRKLFWPKEITTPTDAQEALQERGKKHTSSILMKTIQDIDRDRVLGKRLALNVVRRGIGRGPAPSFPMTTTVTKTPFSRSATGFFSPSANQREIIREEHAYNQSELSELRKDFPQNNLKDAEWINLICERGGDTVVLSEAKMRKLKNIVENPSLFEALEHVLNTCKIEKHPLVDCFTGAWRLAFPTLDLTALESCCKWHDYSGAIKLLRKLGLLYI